MTKQDYGYAYVAMVMGGSIIGGIAALFVKEPNAKRLMPLLGAAYGAAAGIPLLARNLGPHEPYDET